MTARRSSAPPTDAGRGAAPKDEPALSQERIVAAAVDLLDTQGVGGLTMRALADSVGSGVMSLYWHVHSKEHVLDLALDAVLEYRETGDVAQPDDWRNAVVRLAEDWRTAMLRHPWSATLLPSRALGPGILNRLELLSRLLSSGGVPDAELNSAIWALWNHVMGATITRVSFGFTGSEPAATTPGNYPTIERSGLLLDDDWDGAFRNGLDLLLDGLARRRG